MHLMEEAVYELMEIFRVSEEAETAQKNSNEKVYRESAIRKQIEFLQQQLDEMHPENISDVRRFQKKIQESGMNEEARKEAEKVLNRMKQEGKKTAMSMACCTIIWTLPQVFPGSQRNLLKLI